MLALRYHGYRYEYGGWKRDHNSDLNDERAAYWYLQAAQQGHTGAQNALGYCYKYGQGVPENMPAALIWFRKSAENGNSSGQLNLGDCFRDGVKIQEVTDPDCYTCRYERMCKKHPYTQILAVDIDSAMYWWRKSAEQGNDDAKERLEKIY